MLNFLYELLTEIKQTCDSHTIITSVRTERSFSLLFKIGETINVSLRVFFHAYFA